MTAMSQSGDVGASRVVVALAGFMGCGKTSTGEALAEMVGWQFVDLDSEIEVHEGVTVRRLFSERGEAAFRAVEHEVLSEFLVGCERSTVIALGGGAFVQPNNVALLRAKNVVTVFLETPVEHMLERCGVEDVPGPENVRPLAADAAAFRELYERRLPDYRRADITIETAGKDAAEVAQEVARQLGIEP
jgi:shikimate kinase